MSLLFSPYTLTSPNGGVSLANRIVIAPMCQYSADEGAATDWHLAHWSSLLNSGAGLMIIEATAVLEEGRITPHCLGLWDVRTYDALATTLARARRIAPPMPVCIQLSHAGRKAASAVPWAGGAQLSAVQGGWPALAPSAIPQAAHEAPPTELTLEAMYEIREAFVVAAQRAAHMGIDAVELHAAHGYLLHEFLSPLSNQRVDAYGGSLDNRMRFPLEVFAAVRAEFTGPLGVRISATDWVDGGWDTPDAQAFALRLKALGCDFMHVSSGGVAPAQKITLGPGYQVPHASAVKAAAGLPTIAVGLITEPEQAEGILQNGDADLVAIARAILYKPRWPWEAAAALGGQVQASQPYWRCLPREAKDVFGAVRIGMR